MLCCERRGTNKQTNKHICHCFLRQFFHPSFWRDPECRQVISCRVVSFRVLCNETQSPPTPPKKTRVNHYWGQSSPSQFCVLHQTIYCCIVLSDEYGKVGVQITQHDRMTGGTARWPGRYGTMTQTAVAQICRENTKMPQICRENTKKPKHKIFLGGRPMIWFPLRVVSGTKTCRGRPPSVGRKPTHNQKP